MAYQHPSVETSFLITLIESTGKVKDKIQIGSTIILKLDTQSKRLTNNMITLRDLEETGFEFATGTAIKIGKIGELLKWFEENKKWKDGGYFV